MKKIIGFVERKMDVNKRSIDLTRKGFEESFKEGALYEKQTRDDLHLESILKFVDIKPGMKILDIGCGTGFLTFPMAIRNADVSVVGLDIVTNTINWNLEHTINQGIKNLHFITYAGEEFPFDDNVFDLVVTRYALHHFPEIEKSLMEVSRVLKQGGKLFISYPRPNECDKCGMKLLKSFVSEIRFPKKKATAVGLEKVIEKHNKSIIDSYRFEITEEEIWVTEEVNNIMFIKNNTVLRL